MRGGTTAGVIARLREGPLHTEVRRQVGTFASAKTNLLTVGVLEDDGARVAYDVLGKGWGLECCTVRRQNIDESKGGGAILGCDVPKVFLDLQVRRVDHGDGSRDHWRRRRRRRHVVGTEHGVGELLYLLRLRAGTRGVSVTFRARASRACLITTHTLPRERGMLWYKGLIFTLTTVVGALPSTKRVVLVTGANKGIGKEIARQLGALQDHAVVLGCRDSKLGAAAAGLQAAGIDCVFSRLDLCDDSSIAATRDFIEQRYGRLDVLVNNAAICFNDPTLYGKVPRTPFEQQANITLRTNYHGTLAVTQTMLPLLRVSDASPRIVNVASAAGRLRGSQEIQDAFTADDLNIPALSGLMEAFVRDAEAGVHADNGWPNTCYGVSKMGLIALTQVLAKDSLR